MRRRQRGVTYLDVLAATALFGIALVASGGLLLQWRGMSERFEQRAVAEHALAGEMDEVLANAGALELGTQAWLSGADVASGLEGAVGELRVERFEGGGLRRVVITLRWSGGQAVRETLS